jgi:hypothetical protein
MFNIGDKVLFGKKHISKKEYEATITDKHELNSNRYFITLETQLNVQGEQVKRWVDVTDLKLDVKYYREQKINEILKPL